MRRTAVPEDIADPHWALVHRTSARRDFGSYALLGVGLVFAYAGSVIEPASNCSPDGECAPWLVPVAFWIGVVAALGGASAILANPRRGSGVNTRTGELVWWNEVHASASGRLNLSDIAVIRVDDVSDSSTVRLLDTRNEPAPFGGAQVVPWRLETWARSVQALYPHIRDDVAR